MAFNVERGLALKHIGESRGSRAEAAALSSSDRVQCRYRFFRKALVRLWREP